MLDARVGTRRPDFFFRAAEALALCGVWRRYLFAVCFGLMAAAALPPLYILPLLWPAFTGLLWLLDGVKRGRTAFLTAWAFGTGYFLAGLYWVGIAFLVDAEQYAAFMPLAVLGLATGMALFPALAIFAVWRSGQRGVARVFLLVAAWLAMEWLRSWIFTGFPWNLIGTVWAFSDAMPQLATLTGIWGLSAMTVLAAAMPATLNERQDSSPVKRWLPVTAALVLIGVAWAGGQLRISQAPAPGSDQVPGVVLRLVQPSIEQSTKWQADLRRQHVVDQLALTSQEPAAGTQAPGPVSHVIWSETAIPFNLVGDQVLRETVAKIVPPGGLLLSGAPRFERRDDGTELWNSFHALDERGEIVGTYDKFHLVPFGEYVPLKWLFRFAKITQGRLDFTPGPGPRTLTLPGLPPVAPLICYEVIFPGAVVAPGPRPAWILNVTNDAWFGTSSGPYQHFASARFRAIEEGLPLVRVANSGISGVVDGYGRVLNRLELNERGVVDSPLPRPIVTPPLFARLGNWAVLVLVLLCISAAYAAMRSQNR